MGKEDPPEKKSAFLFDRIEDYVNKVCSYLNGSRRLLGTATFRD
jgi:hypothetical protein